MLLLSLVGWLLALFWLGCSGVLLHFFHYHQIEKIVATLPALQTFPKISIIVPARDEESAIGAALMALLALDYPHFEVLAVNDRSSDKTGAIMDAIQATAPQLKVLHIQQLSDGWLGKNHAMHCAAQQATGDYLLFTDGDVIFSPDTLKQAMQIIATQHWDHLSLVPRLLPGNFVENSVVQLMGMLLLIRIQPYRVATANHLFFAGVGAFNLIRRACYQTTGGFDKLRLEVIDDMALGREVKRCGFRSQLLAADPLLQVRWQESLAGLVRGVEKNSFAALNYSILNLVMMTIGFILIFFCPYLAIIFLPAQVAVGFAVALGLLHSLLAFIGHRTKVGWKTNFLLIFSALVTLWAVWRSAFLTLKRGGVCWRDTFYPLQMLKKSSD